MNSSKASLQSRWGFHPCDYSLFVKLKSLHRWYWQTVYDFHRWHRWQRKEAQNRVGPEPRFCDLFVDNSVWHKPARRRGVDGCKVYPKTVIDHGVVDLYRRARMPQAEPVEPFDAETVGRIEELYREAIAKLGN